MVAEMIKHKKKKMSLNGFCAGAVAGLVTITPAAGFVRPYYAVVFGFLGSNKFLIFYFIGIWENNFFCYFL